MICVYRKLLTILCFFSYALGASWASEIVFCEIFIFDFRSNNRVYEEWLSGFVFCVLVLILPVLSFVMPNTRLASMRWLVLTSGMILPSCFILLISFSNVCFILDYPIRIASKLRPADVIDTGGQGSFPLSFDLGADLFHAGLASKIVTFVPNRKLYSSYLHQTLSIPPDAIIWARGKSNNTLIEASSLAKLCRDNSWDSVILVADSHRMFRKFRAFIKAGVPIVYPANVTGDQQWMAPAKFIGVSQQAYWDLNGFECDWFILQQFRHKMVIRTLHEYLGIIFYAVTGYI